MFSLQSDLADTSIAVNGQEVGAWTSGDHSVPYTFQEGTNDIVVRLLNHDTDARFNLSMIKPSEFRDMDSLLRTFSSYRTNPDQDPFDVYYINVDQSANLDNTVSVSLAGLDLTSEVILLLNSENAINWKIVEKDKDLKLRAYINSDRPESSIYGSDYYVQPQVIEDMPRVSTLVDANSALDPIFAQAAKMAIFKNEVRSISLQDPLSNIPDTAAAKPFYGQWDRYNASRNRVERTHVLVQNGQLVMNNGIEIDSTGRVVNAGSLRTPAYTENYFSSLQVQNPAQASVGSVQAAAAPTGATFTVGGITYTKSEPEELLCGGSQPFYGVRNLLIHSPETEEGALLDHCAQRLYEVLKRQPRSGSDLWIHRFPLYLLYLADYQLSLDNHADYEKYLGLAQDLISSLSQEPDYENTQFPDYLSLRNIALALADTDLVTGSSVSTSRGRYARQVMAIGVELEEPITSTNSSEVLASIQKIYEDASYLRTSGAITEVTATATKIGDFIESADTAAGRYITNDSTTTGENLVMALNVGDEALLDISSFASLGSLTQEAGQTYGDQFFIMHANALQDYINTHKSVTFFNMNVHHAIEQGQDRTRHLGYEKLQSIENFRGILANFNDELHLSKIRVCWNQLYANYSSTQDIPETTLIERAQYIDDLYGHLFVPAIRPVPADFDFDNLPDCEPPQ
ncbi:MAG: hypothetical protein GY938_11280 [Ketobacter sp.]|nr:hypothetical protein [Ketobacter sp.]